MAVINCNVKECNSNMDGKCHADTVFIIPVSSANKVVARGLEVVCPYNDEEEEEG